MAAATIPSKCVHVLSVGPFGRAVARYVKTLLGNVTETTIIGDTVPLPQMWPKAHMSVLAAWRPVPNLCELLDELSFEWQRPFIPLVVDSTVMRLGPLVVPGDGCCWRCWMSRCRQHAEWPKEHAALSHYYASRADAGPQGYLEPFALMGATRIAHAVAELDSSVGLAGYVWEMEMLKRNITTSTVVGIHDCPRCGLRRPAFRRSFADMQSELAYLWTPQSSQEQ